MIFSSANGSAAGSVPDAADTRRHPSGEMRDGLVELPLATIQLLSIDAIDDVTGMLNSRLGLVISAGCYRQLSTGVDSIQCTQKSHPYLRQPNRDNAGDGADSRVCTSAVTAVILSRDKKNLNLSGKKFYSGWSVAVGWR